MLVRRAALRTGDGSSWVGRLVGGAIGAAKAALSRLAAKASEVEQGMSSKNEKPARATIRRGSVGRDVAAWQSLLGLDPDATFGAATEAATMAWQTARGLVADGVVGRRSWEAAGERYAEPPRASGDPRAPACVAALRDATARWPSRSRVSDGIMGDARHQASKSDHNLGNAVDITHDPRSGCDGGVIADMAQRDPRTAYVIWDRRIWSRAREAEGWRPYSGSNPHTHHVHISVRADARDDSSPWPWAP